MLSVPGRFTAAARTAAAAAGAEPSPSVRSYPYKAHSGKYQYKYYPQNYFHKPNL